MDFHLLLAGASFPVLYPLQLSGREEGIKLFSSFKERRHAYLNAIPVLAPYLPTAPFEFVCFLFGVCRALLHVGRRGDGGFKVAFEPGIEAGVVFVL